MRDLEGGSLCCGLAQAVTWACSLTLHCEEVHARGEIRAPQGSTASELPTNLAIESQTRCRAFFWLQFLGPPPICKPSAARQRCSCTAPSPALRPAAAAVADARLFSAWPTAVAAHPSIWSDSAESDLSHPPSSQRTSHLPLPLLIFLDRLPTLTSVVFPKSHALLTLLTHPFRPDQKHPLFSASRPTPPRPVAADSRVASSRHLLHL